MRNLLNRSGEVGILPVLGVVIPFLIIVFVAIMSILDVGVEIREYYPSSIPQAEVFAVRNSSLDDYQEENRVGPTVKTIEISNNFIFQRRIPTNEIICYAGFDQSYLTTFGYSVFVDGQSMGSVDYVQVEPGRTQTIELKINKFVSWDNYATPSFSEIYIFEGDRFRMSNCYSLKPHVDGAVKIAIE